MTADSRGEQAMVDVFEEIVRLRKEGRRSALATIVESAGSAPQKAGAKMLVREDGSTAGTLGGGCVEAAAVQAALMAMRDGKPATLPFELTEQHGGLVCGGKILVYIEPIVPEPHLLIAGAGHVGKALAKLAAFSGFRVTVADDREEFANGDAVPDAHACLVLPFDALFHRCRVDADTSVVIATRGHLHDIDALRGALRTDAGYIGLVGSRRKRGLLFRLLRDEGFGEDDISRVTTPAGLSIGSVTPEEIAVSIVAQVIGKRRLHGPSGICGPACSGDIGQNGTSQATPAAR